MSYTMVLLMMFTAALVVLAARHVLQLRYDIFERETLGIGASEQNLAQNAGTYDNLREGRYVEKDRRVREDLRRHLDRLSLYPDLKMNSQASMKMVDEADLSIKGRDIVLTAENPYRRIVVSYFDEDSQLVKDIQDLKKIRKHMGQKWIKKPPQAWEIKHVTFSR